MPPYITSLKASVLRQNMIKISEHCNQATGFPTWSLEYFSQSNSQPIDQKKKAPPQKKRAITNKATAV